MYIMIVNVFLVELESYNFSLFAIAKMFLSKSSRITIPVEFVTADRLTSKNNVIFEVFESYNSREFVTADRRTNKKMFFRSPRELPISREFVTGNGIFFQFQTISLAFCQVGM